MFIRQGLNLATHLVAGVAFGALAAAALGRCMRRGRDEEDLDLEPSSVPPPGATPPPPGAGPTPPGGGPGAPV